MRRAAGLHRALIAGWPDNNGLTDGVKDSVQLLRVIACPIAREACKVVNQGLPLTTGKLT